MGGLHAYGSAPQREVRQAAKRGPKGRMALAMLMPILLKRYVQPNVIRLSRGPSPDTRQPDATPATARSLYWMFSGWR
jgi:hypothetical protein